MATTIPIGDASEVIVGAGLPDPLLINRPDRRMVALLVQPGAAAVGERVAAALAPDVDVLRVDLPDRDAAKTLEVVGGVYERLVDANLGRGDTVVGVGGGATTDVAGFVAATWLRGVEFVTVPTTLLGAVDAAIGGKTAINVRGKNLVGSFWHPARTIVDLVVLRSLPAPLYLEGVAEALKSGLVGDPALVAGFAADGLDFDLESMVVGAVSVKARVVTDDFREEGGRAILNFGHTIGHAVEVVTGMAHGFAVSVGMVAAGAVSAARFGFDGGWLTSLLFELGLPVAASGMSRRAAIDLILRDKKRSAEGVRMVLLRGVGAPVVDVVTAEEIDMALSVVGAG